MTALPIVWLVDTAAAGTAESFLLPLAAAIDREQFQVTVCLLNSRDNKAFEEKLRRARTPVVDLGARSIGDIRAFGRMLRQLREHRPAVIHTHGTDAATWGALAGRRQAIPVVATLYDAPSPARWLHSDAIAEWAMIASLRLYTTRIHAVGDAVRAAFTRKHRLPEGRLQVVHPGIKPADYERRNGERAVQIKQGFGFPADAAVITTVAALQAPKGIDILLRAMAAVLRTMPQARLLIVGEGPLRQHWTQLAQHLGVADAVHWAGARKDVPTLLAGSDLFVLPSRDDAFPAVLLEAMAAEVPIVATNVGGVGEIIDSTAVGSLVPPRDPAALAAEIVHLLQDRERRQSMGVAARRRVAEHFSMQRWVDTLTLAYRHAAGQRTGSLRVAVVEFAGKGAPIHYAYQLCRALSAQGAEVTLLTDAHYELKRLDHRFRVVPLFDSSEPKASAPLLRRALRTVKHYRQWLKLVEHLDTEQYHVMQFGDLRSPGDFVPLRWVRARVRLLSDVTHGVRGHGRNYRLFDHIFVHYEANAARFRARFPASAGRVRVIVRGNDELFREMRAPSKTGERLREQLGLEPREDVVLFFGTLTASSHIDVLIEAFLPVALRHPRARLFIAGPAMPDFDVKRELALARGAALGDRVRIIPGYIDIPSVAAWMELASMVVIPDAESDTVHLAQTFGIPIVAARAGAMAEVVEDGVTGLLVPPDDPHAFAEAISRLLSDNALARRLGATGRATTEQLLGWREVASGILSVYERDYPQMS
jgi:glycosyltransferase involved in cell wall biosynthesis